MTIAGRENLIKAAEAWFPQSRESLKNLELEANGRIIWKIVCVPDANGQFWLEAFLDGGEKVGVILR